MLDKRFYNDSLFTRREEEWDLELIKDKISTLFQNIDLLDNWKFSKVTWAKTKEKRKEELNRHIYKTLKVHIHELTQKKTVKKEHIYNIQIPKLIRGQFFYIGGLLKVPIYQLFDNPIIFRKNGDKNILKFKNNVISMICDINKKDKFTVDVFLNHMKLNKEIPMELLICALYKKEQFHAFIDTLPNVNQIISDLVIRCDKLWKENKETKIIEMLGEYRVSSMAISDNHKKGKSIIFSLSNIFQIDEFSKPFMKTNCPLFELIYALSEGHRSDLDINRKRIRFSEYILTDLIKSIYDMVCILQYNKRVKFKIVSTILLDSCNVSSIVHHNFPYNPVGEISSLIQCTLIGPGTFKKDNVPSHLKNIDESHYGIICPADTPDRDGCGVILNLSPNAGITNDGLLHNNENKNDIICSYPITLVPFMKNDDQTRLQMASGQMKQSILLDNASKPFVKTGAEGNFCEFSSFKEIAKDSGTVIFKSNQFIIVKYDNPELDVELFKLSHRPMYLNSSDELLSDLKLDDKFKKGDTLTYSKFLKDGEITLGQNLLTGVAIWEGYNYEDGIVISDDIQEKYTSVHYVELVVEIEGGQILLSLLDNEYKPIPKIGDKLLKGEVYAKLKNIGVDGVESINIDPKELKSPIDCTITNIEIYPNSWNQQIPQFDNFIKTLIVDQDKKVDEIRDTLDTYLSKEEVENTLDYHELSRLKIPHKILEYGKFSEKGNTFKGVKIKISAVHKSPIAVGDKVSNRHGAKGIISKIVPKDEMPQLEDGRHLEIIVNPLGIISRMNVGQLFELHSTESLFQLKKYLLNSHNKYGSLSDSAIQKLEKYFDIMDATSTKWTSQHIVDKFKKEYKKHPIFAINNLQIIQPAFESIHPKDLIKVMKLTNALFKQTLYDKKGKKFFKNDIAVGYMYFNKLIHRSADKIISRSIGPYVNTTLQPVSGKRNRGGHKLGEMEIWALAAQGAEDTMEELLTTHSDSPGKKLNVLSTILQNDDISILNEAPDKPRSLILLNSMFKTIGLDLEE